MPTITVSGTSNADAQRNPFLSEVVKRMVLEAINNHVTGPVTYRPGAGIDRIDFTGYLTSEPLVQAAVEKAASGYTVVIN